MCPGDAYVCRLLAEWKCGRPHALDLRTGGPQILRQLETVYDGGAHQARADLAEVLLRSAGWLRSKVQSVRAIKLGSLKKNVYLPCLSAYRILTARGGRAGYFL